VAASLKKTSRLVIVDEDVSSGATGYLLDQILVKQNGYQYLDSAPLTISAKDHRPAYGSDGDYFSKPNQDEIFEGIYQMMSETDPEKFPPIY
jgi:pyruvate/2-oxoglutarate/acetoin dehydrogenase E1 component